MKKQPPKKKDYDDNYKKIYRRNWLISVITLGLIVFFAVFYPMITGSGS
jgi:hypothetical protein